MARSGPHHYHYLSHAGGLPRVRRVPSQLTLQSTPLLSTQAVPSGGTAWNQTQGLTRDTSSLPSTSPSHTFSSKRKQAHSHLPGVEMKVPACTRVVFFSLKWSIQAHRAWLWPGGSLFGCQWPGHTGSHQLLVPRVLFPLKTAKPAERDPKQTAAPFPHGGVLICQSSVATALCSEKVWTWEALTSHPQRKKPRRCC